MANAFVQGVRASAGPFATSITTGAPAASTTAGNLLVVQISVSSSDTVTSVTDSAGNTYTKGPALNSSALYWTSEQWYCFNAASVSSSGGSWTVQWGGEQRSVTVHVLEFSGLGVGSVSTSGTHDERTLSGNVVSTSGSAVAGDLVVSSVCSQNGANWSASGWTVQDNGSSDGTADMGSAYILSASSGVQTTTWTTSGSAVDSGASIVCFTPAGSTAVIPLFMNQYRQRWNRSQPFERRKSGLYAPLNSHQRIVRAA